MVRMRKANVISSSLSESKMVTDSTTRDSDWESPIVMISCDGDSTDRVMSESLAVQWSTPIADSLSVGLWLMSRRAPSVDTSYAISSKMRSST